MSTVIELMEFPVRNPAAKPYFIDEDGPYRGLTRRQVHRIAEEMRKRYKGIGKVRCQKLKGKTRIIVSSIDRN